MEIVVRPQAIAAGGDAIGREDSGRVVFVEGAIPGELVRAEIVGARRDFARATVVEVLDPSPDRVTPPCPFVAAGCGGCSWQHIAPGRQRSLKAEIVADALRRIARLPAARVELAPPLPAETRRTTARLAPAGGGRVGFRRAQSHDVVAVDHCLVVHPLLDELLAADYRSAGEVVLRVAAATGQRLAWWKGGGTVRGLPGDVRTGPESFVEEIVGDVRLRVSAGAFFQSSPQAAAALGAIVAGAVGPTPGIAVDAYGGVGLFATGALAAADDVTVIELDAHAAADARHNLRGRRARVVESAVEDWAPRRADVVVADPSRRGLGSQAAAILAATGCTRFVLVSCDAAAGARDIALLGAHGFAHRWSTVLDPFPHTAHVEVVSLLERDATGARTALGTTRGGQP